MALLLLQLSNRGRNRASEQQFATGFNVVIALRVVIVVRQAVETFVEVRETIDTLFDGR